MKSQHPIPLNGSPATIKKIKELYQDHAEFPYISPERPLDDWLEEVSLKGSGLVPKRNMVRTEEGLLPGHIILLWRVSHGTYTVGHWITKYFEYDYGIDGNDIDWLVETGYVRLMTAKESLIYATSPYLKKLLKDKGVKGFSKMKKEELLTRIAETYLEEELLDLIQTRGYALTDKGQAALTNNQAVINKHPKKPGY